MVVDFLLWAAKIYLGIGLLTFVILFVDYYRRLPLPRPSFVEVVGEVLEWSSEWKEVARAILGWPGVWVGLVIMWQDSRAEEAHNRRIDAQREQIRLEEQARWREEASARRAAAVQASKPPRKMRKAVLRRQRRA